MSKYLIGLYVLMTTSALIMLKLGSKNGAPFEILNGRPALNLNIYVISGVGFYGLSFLLYMYLISKFDLGYIIPLTTGFIYIIIFTASYFVFQEAFTIVKTSGIILILAGIILLNLRK